MFETLITEFSNGKRISNRQYDYKGLLGLDYNIFKKAWSSRQHKRMTGELLNFVEVITDILTEHNMPINKAAIQYLYEERIKEKAMPFENIRADIIHLLQNLKEQNIKLGLISNCTEEEVQYWKKSSLARYFDKVIFSYEVGIAKPDKKIYLLSCEVLGVTPSESLFVGDGGSNELDGAESVGMIPCHARWFNSTINSPYSKFESPTELKDEIKKRLC